MNYFQPYGGGVNSLALKLLLIEQGRDCESVFVNHGGDLPETQAHVHMMIEKDFNLTELRPIVEGYDNIYERIPINFVLSSHMQTKAKQ